MGLPNKISVARCLLTCENMRGWLERKETAKL